MSNDRSTTDMIRRLGLDTLSAQKRGKMGEIDAWVPEFLLSGTGGGSNVGFSESLKGAKRWWNGPIEMSLSSLSPAVGTDPSMEYVVDAADWHIWTSRLAATFTDPSALPPLIIEYRAGELSIRDGNTRYGAMQLLGWPTCWIVIWYNTEADFRQHSKELE